MTKTEAQKIPSMRISPDEVTEDCFYYQMAKEGRISGQHAEKAIRRLEHRADTVPIYALRDALAMISNLEKYGAPCAEWCE